MKKPRKLNTMQDLYELAGSSVQIAAALKLHQYTVERWKVAGIPHKYYEPLCELYGVAPYELFKLSNKVRDSNKTYSRKLAK